MSPTLQRDEEAYQAGVTEAERDIAAGHLRLRYGVRGAWGDDLQEQLASRFGVELVVLSCFVTASSLSFEAGYNATMEAFIDDRWGAGSVAAVNEGVQRRRKEAYDAWVAAGKFTSS